MTAKDEVLKILSYAFPDIRECAGEKKVCFALADVLHNVPGQLALAIDGKMTYEDILADIRERFKFRKCERWLDNILDHIHRRQPKNLVD